MYFKWLKLNLKNLSGFQKKNSGICRIFRILRFAFRIFEFDIWQHGSTINCMFLFGLKEKNVFDGPGGDQRSQKCCFRSIWKVTYKVGSGPNPYSILIEKSRFHWGQENGLIRPRPLSWTKNIYFEQHWNKKNVLLKLDH